MSEVVDFFTSAVHETVVSRSFNGRSFSMVIIIAGSLCGEVDLWAASREKLGRAGEH